MCVHIYIYTYILYICANFHIQIFMTPGNLTCPPSPSPTPLDNKKNIRVNGPKGMDSKRDTPRWLQCLAFPPNLFCPISSRTLCL